MFAVPGPQAAAGIQLGLDLRMLRAGFHCLGSYVCYFLHSFFVKYFAKVLFGRIRSSDSQVPCSFSKLWCGTLC